MSIENLRQWDKGTRNFLKFGVPMNWPEQKIIMTTVFYDKSNGHQQKQSQQVEVP